MSGTVEYQESPRMIGGQRIKLTSYKIGDRFYCHIDNVDPGATIARAEGSSREEAEQAALDKATARLGKYQ